VNLAPGRDWNELIDAYLDPRNPLHAQAIAIINDRVTKTATRIARRYAVASYSPKFRESVVNEFVGEALGVIFLKLQTSRPKHNNFPAWCYTTLKNYLIDVWFRNRMPVIDIPEPTDEENEDNGDFWDQVPDPICSVIDIEDPFGPRILSQLEAIPVLRRIIALAFCGLWRRVPKETWTRWLDEGHILTNFPPAELQGIDGVGSRAEFIASCLGMRADAVKQHFYRSFDQLRRILKDEYSHLS
jgi:DNA-directed RNA polymerase specialized sigma24 family protein